MIRNYLSSEELLKMADAAEWLGGGEDEKEKVD